MVDSLRDAQITSPSHMEQAGQRLNSTIGRSVGACSIRDSQACGGEGKAGSACKEKKMRMVQLATVMAKNGLKKILRETVTKISFSKKSQKSLRKYGFC